MQFSPFSPHQTRMEIQKSHFFFFSNGENVFFFFLSKSEIRFEPLKVECKAYLLYLGKLLLDCLIDMSTEREEQLHLGIPFSIKEPN